MPLLSREDTSGSAEAIWRVWLEQGLDPVEPPILPYEVCSVLRQKVQLRKELTDEQEEEALEVSFGLGIETRSPENHIRASWKLATDIGLSTVYDAAYLALAVSESCDLWTADRAFFRKVKNRFDAVRLLETILPPGSG